MIDKKLIIAIAKGILTYVPFASVLLERRKKISKHSGSQAEFCYNLWLSILILLKENGVNSNFKNIGEIGCGGSFGVGICALLTGCERYFALEIDKIFDVEQNLQILDDLIILLKSKTIPSNKYKQINIRITDFNYPNDLIIPVFSQEKNITEIRNDIKNKCMGFGKIQIIRDWETQRPLGLDFIFSRAVMEHVRDPACVYNGIRRHLKPFSTMFHDIEYHSHGLTNDLDGHYFIPNHRWKLICGKRKYFLNRWSYIDHENWIVEHGFQILKTQKTFVNDSHHSEKVLMGGIIIAKKTDE